MKTKVLIVGIYEPYHGTSQSNGKPYTIYKFKAADSEGNESDFKTLSKQIGDKIAVDLECEIEYTEKEYNGKTDYTVNQMWINGEEVKTERKSNYNSDSPEKRASIEAQNAASNIAVVLASPNARDFVTDDMIIGWQIYNRQKLGTCPTELPHEVIDTDVKPPKGEPITIKDWNDFAVQMKAKEWTWAKVHAKAGTKTITDFQAKHKGNASLAFAWLLTEISKEQHK